MSEQCDRNKILGPIAVLAPPGHLDFSDYEHIKDSLSILRPYLHSVIEEKKCGVNIFLYGPPGCGKSQLSRLLAKEMGCQLYEISSEDSSGNPIVSKQRLESLQLANRFLAGRLLLAYEEAEDVFNNGGFFMPSTAKNRKGWINRHLETNPIPTIWIANQLDGLDSANARRFDFVLKLPIPPRKQREKIIHKACAKIASKRLIGELATVDVLAPAVVERAAEVIRTVGKKLPTKKRDAALKELIANTLNAQDASSALKRARGSQLPPVYDLAYLNPNTDLKRLGKGLKKHTQCRMVLYGPPGTGKTSYAYYLAEELGLPIVAKRVSDILDPYIGRTEQKLASAFEQASEENAILLLDEVDSFLQDRRRAQRPWEVTQTNEFLTQMEAFEGIFIASTNLMKKLDQASLRRFDMKIHFGYLQPAQSKRLFIAQCKALGIGLPQDELLQRMAQIEGVTPGDFANVARQHRFRQFDGPEAIFEAVQAECSVKGVRRKGILGFN